MYGPLVHMQTVQLVLMLQQRVYLALDWVTSFQPIHVFLTFDGVRWQGGGGGGMMGEAKNLAGRFGL